MFENDKEPTVVELIKAAENKKIFLPEFQREFVWDKSQIKLLIDSLYNNYTINSILTWEGTDELARRRVGGSINEIQTPELRKDVKINYLLDGQQRTTSLMVIFTDQKVYKKKNTRKVEKIDLFFDTEYNGDDAEVRFIFDDEPIYVNSVEITLNKFSKKDLFEKFGTRFIKLKDVYNQANNQIDYDTIKGLIGDEKKRFEYVQKLSTLVNRILNRKVVNINQPGDLAAVLNIFERINTQNTKLNVYDIMVAKTYKKVDGEYFDLRTFFKILNYDGTIKSDFIENKRNPNIEDVITNGFFLDEATQLFLIMEMINKKFRQKEILQIKTDDLINNMKTLHKNYWYLIKFVKNRFKIENDQLSSYKPILKFLAAYLANNPDITVEKEEFLSKWFWSTALYNRYPGAQNERVQKDFETSKKNDHQKSLDIFKKDRTRQFNEKYLDAYYDSRSQLFDAISLIFINNNAKDFYNRIVALRCGHSNDKLNEHHIFPTNSKIGKKITNETKNTDNEDILDNIANIAFITNETNNKRINNRDPSDYITDFEEQYQKQGIMNDFYMIMESQLINKDMIDDLKSNNFYSFIEKRTKLIKQKINELCGDKND